MGASGPRIDTAELDQVVATFLTRYSGTTYRNYKGNLGRFLTWCTENNCDPLTVSYREIDHYTQSLHDRGLGQSSIAANQTAIASFYKFALGIGAIQASPMAEAKRVYRLKADAPATLTRDQAQGLLRAAEGMGGQYGPALHLLTLNGLSVSQVCALDVQDLFAARSPALLRVGKRRGAAIQMPVSDSTLPLLTALVAGRKTGPLFVAPRDRSSRIDRNQIARMVRRAGRAANLNAHVNPSILRNTAMSLALAAGVSVDAFAAFSSQRDIRRIGQYRTGGLSSRPDDHPVFRIAGQLTGHSASSHLDQLRDLISDPRSVPAAQVWAAGAALEQVLLGMVLQQGLRHEEKHAISKYASALRSKGILTAQEAKEIGAWAGLRNHADHGEFHEITAVRATNMVTGVLDFCENHGVSSSLPTGDVSVIASA